MKPFVWKEGMTETDAKNGAYWERNMLALLLANIMNNEQISDCGWYEHGEWEGWSRVISIDNGSVTFHVPDDFDLGNLSKIKPNWDGHTTEEKWNRIMEYCGIEVSA